MSQWTSGFISGVAATIVGFIFTMLWDVYKYRRDTSQRDESITKIALHEIEENRQASIENIKLIEEELSILDKGKEIVRPLLLMKSGFWDILKGSIPKKLIENIELIESIQSISLLANHINEQIRSRQNYKNAASAMTNYNSSVKIQDNMILADLKRFNKDIDDVLSILQKI